MRYALCAKRGGEVTMPAIAPIEDLRAAQKDGLSIYAMRYALCALRFIGYGFKNGLQKN